MNEKNIQCLSDWLTWVNINSFPWEERKENLFFSIFTFIMFTSHPSIHPTHASQWFHKKNPKNQTKFSSFFKFRQQHWAIFFSLLVTSFCQFCCFFSPLIFYIVWLVYGWRNILVGIFFLSDISYWKREKQKWKNLHIFHLIPMKKKSEKIKCMKNLYGLHLLFRLLLWMTFS